eukprot:6474102-Prymnesium_polylepis.1
MSKSNELGRPNQAVLGRGVSAMATISSRDAPRFHHHAISHDPPIRPRLREGQPLRQSPPNWAVTSAGGPSETLISSTRFPQRNSRHCAKDAPAHPGSWGTTHC